MVLLLPHPGLRANPAPWACRAVILISAPGSSRVPFQASCGSLGSIPVWPCEPHFSKAAVVHEVPLMRGSPFQPEDVLRLQGLLWLGWASCMIQDNLSVLRTSTSITSAKSLLPRSIFIPRWQGLECGHLREVIRLAVVLKSF